MHQKSTLLHLSTILVLLFAAFASRAQVNVTASAGTMGPTNYTTLKASFDAINAGTHQGNINVSISANTTEPAALVLNASGTGACNYSSVLIQPAAGSNPVVSGSVNNNALITLNCAGNVTINGSNNGSNSRNLSFNNTGNSYPQVIRMGGTAANPIHDVVLKNCILTNGTNEIYNIELGPNNATNTSGYFHDITVQNNFVRKSYTGIYLNATVAANNGNNTLITGNDINATGAYCVVGNGIILSGTSGTIVSNNNIGNFGGADTIGGLGIWIESGTKNASIINNTISNIYYTDDLIAYAPLGIWITTDVSNANINVSGNNISNINNAGHYICAGIQLDNSGSGINIGYNKISNIKNVNTTGYGAAGIYLAGTSNSAATKVFNNFVWDIAAVGYNGYAANDNGNGIVVDAGKGYAINYNTVALTPNTTLSTGNNKSSALLVTSGVTAGAVSVTDNILVNLQAGTNANSRLALSNAGSATAFTSINYNDLYSTSGKLSSRGTNASMQTTIAGVQTSIGGNANSVNILPVFNGPNDLHLTLANNLTLNDMGTPLAGITDDIDGDIRNTITPDMGADEFPPCAPANITMQPTSPTYCEGDTAMFVVNTTNGVSYQWQESTGAAFVNIMNTAPYNGATNDTLYIYNTTPSFTGRKYVCVITAKPGCPTTNSDTAIITVTAKTTPTFTAIPAFCSGGVAPVLPLTSLNGITGTWNPATVSNTASATYIFTPTAGQCATTTTLDVTVTPNITPTFTTVPAFCSGSIAPVLPLTSLNGITGTWNPATVSNTASATYIFTPTAGQCAVVTTLDAIVTPNIIPTFTAIPAFCSGSTAPVLPLTSLNGITGTWNPSTVSNTASATYTFTPTTGLCAVVTTLDVIVTPNIIPTFTAIPAFCSGSTAPVLPLTSLNGITGTWNPSTVSNTASATYTFTPTAGQCATTTTLDVTVSNNITPAFTAIGPICSGSIAPVLLLTSLNGINGTWNPAMVNNTATTLYTFTPNAGNCAAPTTMTIVVTPNTTPAFATIAAICNGSVAPVLPLTSLNGITGTWAPATVSNTASATYTFTPAAGQCATTTTLNVTVTPNVAPTFNAVPAFCSGSTAPVLPTTSLNGITGIWNPATVSNTASATYTFTPIAGQCASTTTLNVTVTPNATPSFAAIGPICSGSVAPVLPATSLNSITGTWNPATVNNTTTGTYTFTPTAGICAMPVSITVIVNNNTLPTFAAVASFCKGSVAPVLPLISLNGIAGTWLPATVSNIASGNYVFTPTASACALQTSLNIVVKDPVSYTDAQTICASQLPYTWNGIANAATGAIFTAAAANACDSVVTLQLTVLPSAATVSKDTAACGYLWLNNIRYTQSTTISDTFYNTLGCDSLIRYTHIVIYPNTPELHTQTLVGCDALYFEGHNYDRDATLVDTFRSVYGCDSSIRVVNIAIVHFRLSLSMMPTNPYKGERIQLQTTAGEEPYYVTSWSPEALFPNQTNKENETVANQDEIIIVTATDENGCKDTASIRYEVKPLDYGVFMPNAFSPNGDGLNDVFGPHVYMNRAYTVEAFDIYNRWGQRIYNASNTPNAGWDGSQNGHPVDLGTYNYYIIIRFIDGKEVIKKGDVTLLR